jgi:hypothetical protein
MLVKLANPGIQVGLKADRCLVVGRLEYEARCYSMSYGIPN